MRVLQKKLTLTTLVSTLGIVEGATLCLEQPIDIDLNSQRIGIWKKRLIQLFLVLPRQVQKLFPLICLVM